MAFCAYCGKQRDVGSAFCTECGVKFNIENESYTTNFPKPNTTSKKIVKIAIIVLLVFAVSAGAIIFVSNNNTRDLVGTWQMLNAFGGRSLNHYEFNKDNTGATWMMYRGEILFGPHSFLWSVNRNRLTLEFENGNIRYFYFLVSENELHMNNLRLIRIL